MKTRRSKLGVSILAGALSFVGTANATNLLLNSGFETYSGGGDVYGQRGTNDWIGYFSQYNHTTEAYYDGPDIPASESPGTYYSWSQAADYGMWDNFTTPEDQGFFLANEIWAYALTQTVALTNAVSGADIDAGSGLYTFSAWLASYNGNPEQPFLLLRFFDDSATQDAGTGNQIGDNVIFDRTTNTFAVTYADGTTNISPDLSNDHNWIKYVATGTVPATARKARVYVTRSPNAAKVNSPDTYIDLVKLDVTGPAPIAPTITIPPTSQTAAVGNSVTFSVMASGTDPAYQWRHSGMNLPGSTSTALVLPVVQATNAGPYDVVVTNIAGAVTSTPPAILTVINPAVFVTGQWDFLLGNLAASYGADLKYFDSDVQTDTSFGTTTDLGIPDINGTPTSVMHFTPPVAQWGGYIMYHGAAPNGGGAYVNQYTLIYDVYYPLASDGTWRSLLQTDTSNDSDNDGDLFVGTSDGIGISGVYDGDVTAEAWHRLAFAFDLSGPGQAPVLAKFIDGVKVGNQILGEGIDGRWSLDTSALLFADNDGDVAETYVSSVQFSNGRRPDAFIEALGGPSALKIPGAIRADLIGGNVVIRWTGGVPLQSADSLTGPWTTVPLSAGQFSYTPSPLGPAKFYRPQMP